MIPCRHKAFTLIELLIVVAIIGILAAIAVPNFMNARVRAKIALVQGNFNTLATALDMYRLDHGVYPIVTHRRITVGWLAYLPLHDWNVITTPVAYVSPAAFVDPFIHDRMHHREINTLTWGSERKWYEVGHLWGYDEWNEGGRLNKQQWAIGSIGPDVGAGDWTVYNQRRLEHIKDTDNLEVYPFFTNLNQYDSSNGLISNGDIHRFSTGRPSPYTRLIDGQPGPLAIN